MNAIKYQVYTRAIYIRNLYTLVLWLGHPWNNKQTHWILNLSEWTAKPVMPYTKLKYACTILYVDTIHYTVVQCFSVRLLLHISSILAILRLLHQAHFALNSYASSDGGSRTCKPRWRPVTSSLEPPSLLIRSTVLITDSYVVKDWQTGQKEDWKR